MLEFVGRAFTNTGTLFLQSVGVQFPDPELDGGGHLTLYAATFENVDNFISGSATTPA